MLKLSKLLNVDAKHYVEESMSTGIFEWQELAQLDFQELINIARKKSDFSDSKEIAVQADFF